MQDLSVLVLTTACESRIISKESVKKYLCSVLTWPQALLWRERKLVSSEAQWLGTVAMSPIALVTEIYRQQGTMGRILEFKPTRFCILVSKLWANFLTSFRLSFLICKMCCWRISCEYKKRMPLCFIFNWPAYAQIVAYNTHQKIVISPSSSHLLPQFLILHLQHTNVFIFSTCRVSQHRNNGHIRHPPLKWIPLC